MFERSIAFNRTSMESKLDIFMLVCNLMYLLIEPVWNRNVVRFLGAGVVNRLLIEPVWNRNAERESRLGECYLPLLIEPVWNRNSCCHDTTGYQCRQLLIEPVWNRNLRNGDLDVRLKHTFNRTSMESKL